MRVVLTGRVPTEAVAMLAAEHEVAAWESEDLVTNSGSAHRRDG